MNKYHNENCEFSNHREDGMCFYYAIYHDEGSNEFYTCLECNKKFGGVGKFDVNGHPIDSSDDYYLGTIRGVMVGEGWDENLCNECFAKKAPAKLYKRLVYAQNHQWDYLELEDKIERLQRELNNKIKKIPEFLNYTIV